MGTKVRQTQDPHRSWLLGKFPLNIKGLRIKLDNKCEVPIRVVRTWGLPGGPVVSSAFTAGVPGSICGRALRSHKSHDAAKKKKKDFPGGAVDKNPPANAGDTGSIPGPGRSHMLQGNYGRAPQLLNPHSRACGATTNKPGCCHY